MLKKIASTTMVLLAFAAVSGCAPANYKVNAPSPSTYTYHQPSVKTLALAINDQRQEKEKTFSYGTLNAGLMIAGKPIDPIAYLKEFTPKELAARGVVTSVQTAADTSIAVKKITIRNHRANGFSPFVTFSMLSADVTTASGKQRIGVYIKRGKVPVWSFDEVIDPTFNEPLDLIVKEFAAKINTLVTKQAISDEQVKTLAAQVAANPLEPKAYLKIYELGFGNNKSAVAHLTKWLAHADEYVRLAAISSLGNLQANSEFASLKNLYNTAPLWQDRAMALKAICDLTSPDAQAFARQTYSELSKKDLKKDNDLAWTKELLDLYFL